VGNFTKEKAHLFGTVKKRKPRQVKTRKKRDAQKKFQYKAHTGFKKEWTQQGQTTWKLKKINNQGGDEGSQKKKK